MHSLTHMHTHAHARKHACKHTHTLAGVWNGAVVAVKVLEHLRQDEDPDSPDKEAILNGQLSHPSIVSALRRQRARAGSPCMLGACSSRGSFEEAVQLEHARMCMRVCSVSGCWRGVLVGEGAVLAPGCWRNVQDGNAAALVRTSAAGSTRAQHSAMTRTGASTAQYWAQVQAHKPRTAHHRRHIRARAQVQMYKSCAREVGRSQVEDGQPIMETWMVMVRALPALWGMRMLTWMVMVHALPALWGMRMMRCGACRC